MSDTLVEGSTPIKETSQNSTSYNCVPASLNHYLGSRVRELSLSCNAGVTKLHACACCHFHPHSPRGPGPPAHPRFTKCARLERITRETWYQVFATAITAILASEGFYPARVGLYTVNRVFLYLATV